MPLPAFPLGGPGTAFRRGLLEGIYAGNAVDDMGYNGCDRLIAWVQINAPVGQTDSDTGCTIVGVSISACSTSYPCGGVYVGNEVEHPEILPGPVGSNPVLIFHEVCA